MAGTGKEHRQSVDLTKEPDQHNESLTKHQKAIVDYAAVHNNAQTEEIVTRTRHAVHNEINGAFETFTKINTTRKIGMAVGAVLAFGLGWLIGGWVRDRGSEEGMEDQNGMND